MARPQVGWKPTDPPSCTGEKTRWTAHGYIKERCPSHPGCDAYGFVPQHRLVVEAHIGRYLSGMELVHHKNENKSDNRLENLEIVSYRKHRLIHQKPCPLTEEMVREALQGRTTSQAARLLGYHHQTLRNHFDYLLTKRRKPHKIDDEELRKAILRYAPDRNMGSVEFQKEFQVGGKMMWRMCRELGVDWVKKTRSDKDRKRKPRTAEIKADGPGIEFVPQNQF